MIKDTLNQSSLGLKLQINIYNKEDIDHTVMNLSHIVKEDKISKVSMLVKECQSLK